MTGETTMTLALLVVIGMSPPARCARAVGPLALRAGAPSRRAAERVIAGSIRRAGDAVERVNSESYSYVRPSHSTGLIGGQWHRLPWCHCQTCAGRLMRGVRKPLDVRLSLGLRKMFCGGGIEAVGRIDECHSCSTSIRGDLLPVNSDDAASRPRCVVGVMDWAVESLAKDVRDDRLDGRLRLCAQGRNHPATATGRR